MPKPFLGAFSVLLFGAIICSGLNTRAGTVPQSDCGDHYTAFIPDFGGSATQYIAHPDLFYVEAFRVEKVKYVYPWLIAVKLPPAPFISRQEWKSFYLKE